METNVRAYSFIRVYQPWGPRLISVYYSDFDDAFNYRKFELFDFWRLKDSQPEEVWAASDKPHIMVSMSHEYASDNDCFFCFFFRTEIQIITLMIIRLINNSFPDHNVVPVMMFSFTDDRKRRILKAHMDSKSLVIQKSDFYDFSARPDANLAPFLRNMVCDVQGETKILTLPSVKLKRVNPLGFNYLMTFAGKFGEFFQNSISNVQWNS